VFFFSSTTINSSLIFFEDKDFFFFDLELAFKPAFRVGAFDFVCLCGTFLVADFSLAGFLFLDELFLLLFLDPFFVKVFVVFVDFF